MDEFLAEAIAFAILMLLLCIVVSFFLKGEFL